MAKERFEIPQDFLYIVRAQLFNTRAEGEIFYAALLYEIRGEEYKHSDERVDFFLEVWKKCYSKRYAEEDTI